MTYFTRDGRPFDNIAFALLHDGKHPYYRAPRACGRCGGLGGSDAWKHTGWKCYACGGSGRHPDGPSKVRLYLAEELAKLNSAKAKRDATAQRKRDAAAAKAQAEADARMLGFLAQYGELLAKAEKYEGRSEFIRDVRAKAMKDCKLTEKQAAAMEKVISSIEASEKKKAASEYVGTIGKRMRGLKVTVERRVTIAIVSSFSDRLTITTLRTEFGETIVVKSNAFYPRKGAVLIIDGTPKEHSIYNGEKQTQLSRVTIKETVFEPEEDREAA